MAEKLKECPQCLTPMKKEKRAPPESDSRFSGADYWVCPKCGTVEPVEGASRP